MKSITIQSSVSTGLDPALASPQNIELDDKPLGQGGFGVVYRSTRVDGRQAKPLAVKLFFEDTPEMARRGLETIEQLQRKLAVEQQQLARTGRSLLTQYPALAAIPLLSFHGRLEGRTVSGYAASDLSAAGLEEFGGVLEDDAKIAQFQAMPLPAKMELAMQLVSALEFLYSQIGFLHCDLKAEALFVGVRPPQCVLIDYDGGAVMRDPDDMPTTCGTRQDWLAPEILAQMQDAALAQIVQVSLASELWSGAIAVHHLLFGFHPMFFLSEVSSRSIEDYNRRFAWPDIDKRFTYFRVGMERIHAAYTRFLQSSFPAELLRHFRFTMSQGYGNPKQRTTFSQWKTALGVANSPTILRFQADRTVVCDRKPVRLSWEVTGAVSLELEGIGDVTGRSWYELPVTQSREVVLILTPHVGRPITDTLRIEVDDRPPRIHAFYADRHLLTDARPVRLSWAITGADRVEIDGGVGDVTQYSYVDLRPLRDSRFTLRAISGLGAEARASLSLQVSREAPVIEHFRLRPVIVRPGEEVELDWKVIGAEKVMLEPGIGEVVAQDRRKVPMSQQGSFKLRATSRFGVESSRELKVPVLKLTALVGPRTMLRKPTEHRRLMEKGLQSLRQGVARGETC